MSEEIVNEEETSFTSTAEFDKVYQQLISKIPVGDHRVASCVIYGHYRDWGVQKTCKYYGISIEEYNHYSEIFNFKQRMVKEMTGRKSKQDNIVNFLKVNVGKVVTPVQVATGTEVSLPTFYNFYNANRSYFKKVKRGHFEIVNPEMERANS
jgi:hypothetical protein